MAVTRRTRFEVLRRDEHRCRYCGAKAPEVELTVDHVVPVALGGSDHPSNLVAACRDCNSGKTSTTPDAPLVAETNAMAMEWSRAMAIAAKEREQAYAEDRRLARDFRDMWENWVWTDSHGEEHPHELPAGFSTSVRNVLAAGLTFADLEELVGATMQTRNVRDRFKYFCGCCWTRVRDAQERPRNPCPRTSRRAANSARGRVGKSRSELLGRIFRRRVARRVSGGPQAAALHGRDHGLTVQGPGRRGRLPLSRWVGAQPITVSEMRLDLEMPAIQGSLPLGQLEKFIQSAYNLGATADTPVQLVAVYNTDDMLDCLRVEVTEEADRAS